MCPYDNIQTIREKDVKRREKRAQGKAYIFAYLRMADGLGIVRPWRRWQRRWWGNDLWINNLL